jgi:hypothetical protein
LNFSDVLRQSSLRTCQTHLLPQRQVTLRRFHNELGELADIPQFRFSPLLASIGMLDHPSPAFLDLLDYLKKECTLFKVV